MALSLSIELWQCVPRWGVVVIGFWWNVASFLQNDWGRRSGNSRNIGLRVRVRPANAISHGAARLRASADAMLWYVGEGVVVTVADTKLSDRTQLPSHPRRQDLPALLLAETRAREIPVGNESDDIRHNLVLVQNHIDNDRNQRGQVGLASDFDHDNDQTTGLEDSTVDLS